MANNPKFIEVLFCGTVSSKGEEFLRHFGKVDLVSGKATFTVNNQAYSDGTCCTKMLEAALCLGRF